MNKNFKDNLRFGQQGEAEIEQLLIKKGYTILPLYQFDADHAPYIHSNEDEINSPDLICFKDKKITYVEVKTKNKWMRYYDLVRTGFDIRQYNHYKRLKEVTGIDLYIFFNHKKESPTGIYFTELDNEHIFFENTKLKESYCLYDFKNLRKFE